MQGFCTRLKLTPEIRVQQIYPIRFYNELLLFSSKMCHMSIRYAQQLQPTKLTRNLLRNCEKEHYNSPFPRHLINFNIFAIVHCLNCKTYFIQYEVFVLCFRFCVRKYVVKCETLFFFFACRLSPPHISYIFFIVPTQAITISISLPFLYPCQMTIKVGASAYWHRNICTYTIAWSDIAIPYICPQCDVQIMKVVLTLLPDSIIMIAKQANCVQKFILTCSDGRAKFDILNNHAHAEWLRLLTFHMVRARGSKKLLYLVQHVAAYSSTWK